MPLEPGDIMESLSKAREAVSTNRAEVARSSGFDYGVIQKYEGARPTGDPNWVYPIQYMAWLAAQNIGARAEILKLLGIPTAEAVDDPELQRKIGLVKAAHGHESPAIRSVFDALETCLREMNGHLASTSGI